MYKFGNNFYRSGFAFISPDGFCISLETSFISLDAIFCKFGYHFLLQSLVCFFENMFSFGGNTPNLEEIMTFWGKYFFFNLVANILISGGGYSKIDVIPLFMFFLYKTDFEEPAHIARCLRCMRLVRIR